MRGIECEPDGGAHGARERAITPLFCAVTRGFGRADSRWRAGPRPSASCACGARVGRRVVRECTSLSRARHLCRRAAFGDGERPRPLARPARPARPCRGWAATRTCAGRHQTKSSSSLRLSTRAGLARARVSQPASACTHLLLLRCVRVFSLVRRVVAVLGRFKRKRRTTSASSRRSTRRTRGGQHVIAQRARLVQSAANRQTRFPRSIGAYMPHTCTTETKATKSMRSRRTATDGQNAGQPAHAASDNTTR